MSKKKLPKFKYDASNGLAPEILRITQPSIIDSPSSSRREPRTTEETTWKSVNSQLCAYCLNGGDILCCDVCPASFHLTCLSPELKEEDVPEGVWLCNRCMHTPKDSRFVSKTVFTSGGQNGPKADPVVRDTVERRRNDEAIKFHYTKLSKGERKDKWPSKRLLTSLQRANDQMFELPESELDELHVKTPYDVVKNRRPDIFDEKCFYCGLRNLWSPMLKCDFCPLLWHLECVNPPLTVPPTWRLWMCPAHVESFIDEKIIEGRICTGTQRKRIWEMFTHIPLDETSRKRMFDEFMYKTLIERAEQTIIIQLQNLQIESDTRARAKAISAPSTSSASDDRDDVETCEPSTSTADAATGKAGKSARSDLLIATGLLQMRFGGNLGAFGKCLVEKSGREVRRSRGRRKMNTDQNVRFFDETFMLALPEADKDISREQGHASTSNNRRLSREEKEGEDEDDMRSIPIPHDELWKDEHGATYADRSEKWDLRTKHDNEIREMTEVMRKMYYYQDLYAGSFYATETYLDPQDLINRCKSQLRIKSEIPKCLVSDWQPTPPPPPTPPKKKKSRAIKKAKIKECSEVIAAIGMGSRYTEHRANSFATEMFISRTVPVPKAKFVPSPSSLRHTVVSSHNILQLGGTGRLPRQIPDPRDYEKLVLFFYDYTFKTAEERDSFYPSSMAPWSRMAFEDVLKEYQETITDDNKWSDDEAKSEVPPSETNCADDDVAAESKKEENNDSMTVNGSDRKTTRSPLKELTPDKDAEMTSSRATAFARSVATLKRRESKEDLSSDSVSRKVSSSTPSAQESTADATEFSVSSAASSNGRSDVIGERRIGDEESERPTNMNEVIKRATIEHKDVEMTEVSEDVTPEKTAGSCTVLMCSPGYLERLAKEDEEEAEEPMETDDVMTNGNSSQGNVVETDKTEAGSSDITAPETAEDCQASTSQNDSVNGAEAETMDCAEPNGVEQPSTSTQQSSRESTTTTDELERVSLAGSSSMASSSSHLSGPLCPLEQSGPLTLPTTYMNGRTKSVLEYRRMMIHPALRDHDYVPPPKDYSSLFTNHSSGPIVPIHKTPSPLPARRGRGRPLGSKNKIRGKRTDETTPQKPPSGKKRGRPKGSKIIHDSPRTVGLRSDQSTEKVKVSNTEMSTEQKTEMMTKVKLVEKDYISKLLALSKEQMKQGFERTRDDAIRTWDDVAWETFRTALREKQSSLPFDMRYFLPRKTIFGIIEVTRGRRKELPFAVQRGLTKIGHANDCHVKIDRASCDMCAEIEDYHCDIIYDHPSRTFHVSTLGRSTIVVDGVVVFRRELSDLEKACRWQTSADSKEKRFLCACEERLEQLEKKQKVDGTLNDVGLARLKDESIIEIGCVSVKVDIPKQYW